MTNFDEIFERIKAATSTRTQVELADVLDIRQSSISDAKRRNSVPAEWYMKLFEQFGLNPDWLKKGVGPMYLRTEQGYTPVDAPIAAMAMEEAGKYSSADGKNAVVTVHSTQLPLDGDESGAPVLGRLSIPQSFSTQGLYVVKIENASMEPFVKKGAYVGVDTTCKRVASGEMYAVNLPYEGVVLKHAFIDTQNSKLLLQSGNPAHPEVSLPLEGYEKHIVGKAIWVLQKF